MSIKTFPSILGKQGNLLKRQWSGPWFQRTVPQTQEAWMVGNQSKTGWKIALHAGVLQSVFQ